MHQIPQIEFRNAKFPPPGGSAPWTPALVINFTAPRGEAILDPPVYEPIVLWRKGDGFWLFL